MAFIISISRWKNKFGFISECYFYQFFNSRPKSKWNFFRNFYFRKKNNQKMIHSNGTDFFHFASIQLKLLLLLHAVQTAVCELKHWDVFGAAFDTLVSAKIRNIAKFTCVCDSQENSRVLYTPSKYIYIFKENLQSTQNELQSRGFNICIARTEHFCWTNCCRNLLCR